MIIYKCDLCDAVRDCTPREIERKEYDICPECWSELTSKLRGKGRSRTERATHHAPPAIIPELPIEKKAPFPGQPPEIIGQLGGQSALPN